MKIFVALLLILFGSTHAMAAPGTDRTSPMGDRSAWFDKIIYTNANKKVEFQYYLLGPKKITKGAKYPLIVVLHGRSGHAYGAYVLADQIVNQDMPAFVVVPVMGPKVDDWTKDMWRAADPAMPRPIDHVAAMTTQLITQLPIDPSRVYVTGYSMGGMGTWGALYYYPELFAAGIPICGGWYPQDAKRFVGKPIWAFHGKADSLVPVKQTTDMIAAVRKAGGAPHMTLYPDVDHNSWIQAYAEPEIWTWLFSQTNGQAESAKKADISSQEPAPERTSEKIIKTAPRDTAKAIRMF